MLKLVLTGFSIILICISCNKKVKILSDNSSDNEYYLSDNSQNALDWNGIYQVIMPCADCEGIKTEVRLNLDNTFVLKTRYLGKEDTVFIENGTFKWDKKGAKIILNEDKSHQYLVGENVLFKLDLNGEPITGNLSYYYELPKIDYSFKLLETQWNLIELENQKVNNSKAHIIFNGEQMKLIGSGGCNSFKGKFVFSDENTKIDITDIKSTKMFCELSYNETIFFQALTDIKNFSIKDDTLSLSTNSSASNLRFVANF